MAILATTHRRYGLTLEERLWRRVVKTEGCWLWTGSVNEHGYGTIKVASRCVLVHRVVYELYKGTPVNNVLHTCDTPACCRFDHLYDGTQSQNLKDAYARGRREVMPFCAAGEKNGHAKITVEIAAEIRAMHSCGVYTQQQIAKHYGLHQVTVSAIVRGQTWRVS